MFLAVQGQISRFHNLWTHSLQLGAYVRIVISKVVSTHRTGTHPFGNLYQQAMFVDSFHSWPGIYKSTRKRWWLTPKPTKMEPKWCKNASKNWPQKNPKKTSGGRISEPHGVSPYPPQDNLTAWQNLQSLPHSVHESDET